MHEDKNRYTHVQRYRLLNQRIANVARNRTRKTPRTAAIVSTIILPPGSEFVGGFIMDVWLVDVLLAIVDETVGGF